MTTMIHKKVICKKGRIILFTISFIFLIFIHFNLGITFKDTPKLEISNATNHSTIFLDGNYELETFCTKGNGSEEDPFIIENLNIDAIDATGIEIRNTNAYLIIRDCSIESYNKAKLGMDIRNCGNITITNNILQNAYDGIFLAGCYSTVISNNLLIGNGVGINLVNSNYNHIMANNLIQNEDGIILGSSHRNLVSGNNCSNNLYGITLDISKYNIIENNFLFNNSINGIRLRYDLTEFNIVRDNDCVFNEIGIYLLFPQNNEILRNNCSFNRKDGIYSYGSESNLVLGNNCSFNLNHGIRLQSSDFSNITENICVSNGYYGIYSSSCYNNNLSANLYQSETYIGIFLESSRDAILSENILNQCSFKILGGDNNKIDISNKIDGKSVRYFEDCTNLNISGIQDVGQLILINCTNSIIEDLKISNIYKGIYLEHSFNNTIAWNNCSNNSYGIALYLSSNNSIWENKCLQNMKSGIYLDFNSNYNNISKNFCAYNEHSGITARTSSDYNFIMDNNCSFNKLNGIHLSDTDYNIISRNNCSFNENYGIYLFQYEPNHHNVLDENFGVNNGNGFFCIEEYEDEDYEDYPPDGNDPDPDPSKIPGYFINFFGFIGIFSIIFLFLSIVKKKKANF